MLQPGNLDVAAIYVEGLMNLKPWALWTGHAQGRDAIKPSDDNTLTLIKVLEDSFNLKGTHAAHGLTVFVPSGCVLRKVCVCVRPAKN